MGNTVRTARASKDPPAIWVARLLAALTARFPGADLGRQAVARLLPHFRDVWQRGLSIPQAAGTLYSCDGRRLEPSPAISQVPWVRAPRGAKPGDVFSAAELREPARIAALIQRQARLSMQIGTLRSQHAVQTATHKGASHVDLAQRIGALQTELRHVEQALQIARTPLSTSQKSNRRPRSAAACPPAQVACKIGLLGGVCGLPAPLVLAAAQGMMPIVRTARYCLTSASALVPSHLPSRGFVPNPKYPTEVQERAYDRDKGEQLKVIGIAQNLVPELVFNGAPGAIDGLPVVTPTGIVLGGNGRTMALQLHYSQGGRVPRDYLKAHGRLFGFSAAQIEAVPEPVIVRVIQIPAPGAVGYKRELRELVRLLNVPLLKSLDIRSESVAEGRRLTDEALDVLSAMLTEDMTLSEYLSSPSSKAFAGALRRAGVLTDRNAVQLLTADGQSFGQEGKRFVERLLLGALIPDAELLEHLDGRVREALARSAPWWLSAAAGGIDWDLRPALKAAVRDLIDLRREGAPSVESYLRQVRMGNADAEAGIPLAHEMLQILAEFGTRPLVLGRIAREFASLSRQHPSAQGNLLGAEKVSPEQALRKAQQLR